MPTPIELSLSSLLPTTSFLPPELIALSTSLLAQSRTKAASLKPEEEVGRSYACCHISCERLKNSLALEVAKPTPPVKPRVYNKLHTYLDSVLRTNAAPKTPSRKRTEDRLQDGGATRPTRRNGDQKETPTKAATTPQPSRKRAAGVSIGGLHSETGVPSFVMPMIRQICKAFKTHEAAPHVFAGVSSVLQAHGTGEPASKKRRTTTTKLDDTAPYAEDTLPAVIVTLFFAVSKKMYGRETTDNVESRAKAVQTVKEYCKANAEQLPDKLDTSSTMGYDIEGLMVGAVNEWMEMEWYQNVLELGSADENPATEDENEDDEARLTPAKRPAKTPLRRKEKHGKRILEEDSDDVGAAGLLPGLGTMFQPAIDWLSDERRAEFALWKQDVLREAAVIEQQV